MLDGSGWLPGSWCWHGKASEGRPQRGDLHQRKTALTCCRALRPWAPARAAAIKQARRRIQPGGRRMAKVGFREGFCEEMRVHFLRVFVAGVRLALKLECRLAGLNRWLSQMQEGRGKDAVRPACRAVEGGSLTSPGSPPRSTKHAQLPLRLISKRLSFAERCG